jgi:hypothetical protein
MKKVVHLWEYQKHVDFSHGDKNAAKIVSERDIAKTPECPGIKGVTAMDSAPALGQLGGKPAASKKKKPAEHAKPIASPTPGPDGYKLDCAHMTPGQLHAAYPGEYQSWKDGKSRCKQKGWPWAAEWKLFRDFLLSMGPKTSPEDTLDRIDNTVGAYGPGLCRWASKTVQNNNKSDNVKIVVPLTGEVFSAQSLAKLHGVNVKTVYKWKANNYSELEIIAGKKSKALHALSVALAEMPIIQSKKNKKPAVRQIKVPTYAPPSFPDEWEPTDAEYARYIETGELQGLTSHELYRAEFDVFVDWITSHNAGLPVSPQPPQGRYIKPKLPATVLASQPQSVSKPYSWE